MRNKAVLYLTRLRSAQQLLADGTAQPQLRPPGIPAEPAKGASARESAGSSASERPAPWQERAERPAPEKDSEGLYIKNRRGVKLCHDYFLGKCHKSNCKDAHQCRICLQTHTEEQHESGGKGGRGTKRKRGGGKGR